MRSVLVTLFLLLALPAQARTDSVLLRWNVPTDSALAFRTAMRAAEPQMATGPGSLIPTVERSDLTTVLRERPDGQIGVEMIQGEVEFADDSTAALFEMLQEMQEALGGTQLRARITASGEITSFWLAPEQKNILALFFELPKDSISVGDVWGLNGTHLLSLRGPFEVDEASRTNEVRLVALEGETASPLAVLDYDLRERIEGSFGHMEFVFGVAAGTWRRSGGRMTIESTFMGSQSSAQEFALEPVALPSSGK